MSSERHDTRQVGITLWHCLTCPGHPTFHGMVATMAHEDGK